MTEVNYPQPVHENAAHSLDRLTNTIRNYGFTEYAIGIDFHGPVPMAVECTYPDAWQQRYFSRQYTRLDPVISFGMALRRPITWEEIRRDRSQRRDKVMKEAADFGLLHGVVVPIVTGNHRSIVSMVGEIRRKPDVLALSGIIELGQRLAKACVRGKIIEAHMDDLSPTQLATLQMLAEGKTQAEIAGHFRKSPDAVKQTIEILMRKFDARNSTSLVALALRQNVIE